MKLSKFTISMILLVLVIVAFFTFVLFRTDIRKGDAVLLDYTGSVAGKEFDGGKDTDATLVIGSGSFIDGFEDQIIGHSAGDEFDIKVTFPSNYSSKDLAGKDATFAIVIKGYYKPENNKTYGEVSKDQLKELKEAIKKTKENAS